MFLKPAFCGTSQKKKNRKKLQWKLFFSKILKSVTGTYLESSETFIKELFCENE